MEKKYRLLTSIAGTDCSFRVKEIVVAGDAHGEGVMERSMLEALLRGEGYIEEVVEEKETKKSKAPIAATAVRSHAGVETAEVRPV
jgi:hypothetical protein